MKRGKCEHCTRKDGHWNAISADIFANYEIEFRVRKRGGGKANLCEDCIKYMLWKFGKELWTPDARIIILKDRQWR